tara:strand:- start:1 stop:435 length:435 start_codon:yes stop_codon:yes gene_type:complete
MNKKDLKQLIKPLVKECIHEVLIEEGMLSNIVSEVTKGMQGNLVVENKQDKKQQDLFNEDLQIKRKSKEARMKLEQHRRKMADAVGKDAYNGVDLFEGTTPLKSGGNSNAGTQMPDILGEDSNDSGVDISSILGNASKVWKAIK